ncbi:MAG: TonB-dependent receptor [Gammaproteobacteria bacterium]|nr:TonB-dependent receptor [Gammaproteobacteria bacterium]
MVKGTSQIKYGPHTTGGAINYQSTPVPGSERTFLRGQFGDDNEYRTHAYHGNTVDTDIGRVGYLAEFYLRDTEGFKSIDSAPDFTDTDNTGFHNIEPMLKLIWEPNTATYNRFEIKYGFTDRELDEGYLGLNTADFRRDPNRRYSSTRFDNIDAEQHRTHLRHFFSPNENFDLVTTAYYNKFQRNWFKLHDIRDVAGVGGNDFNLSRALAGGGDALACLKGNINCTLNVRNNRREYASYGVETQGTVRFDTGELAHELQVGVRYHRDEEDRFQNEQRFQQTANGAVTGSSLTGPGAAGNRVDEAEAIALFVRDRIEYGDWWFTPGFRYENVELQRTSFDKANDPNRLNPEVKEATVDMLGGGIGIGYNWTPEWQTFGGVHFGFSPPSPGGATGDAGQTEETSIGYELGTRYSSRDGVMQAELIGFLTRFDDLIVTDNIGGTGSGDTQNLGEAQTLGVEVSGQYDLGLAQGWSFSNPYFLAYTYTDAELRSNTGSTDAESIFSFGRKGNEIPYITDNQLTVGSSLDFARWGASVTMIYVDEVFASANNVSRQVDGNGNPDARFGKIDSYKIVDFSAHYNLRPKTKLFAGMHNAFDEEYIATRLPHGPRPGRDRTWFVGFEVEL